MLQRRAWKIISFTIHPASRFIYLRCILFNERQQQGRGRRGGGGALSRADEGASRMGIAPGHIIVSLGRAGERPLAGPTDGISGILRFVCFQPANPFPCACTLALSPRLLFFSLAHGRCPWSACIMRWAVGWLVVRSVGRLPLRSFRDEVCCGNWSFPCVSIFH